VFRDKVGLDARLVLLLIKERKIMGINQQLFEDILSGKLTGKFTLRNGEICSSTNLCRNNSFLKATHPYKLGIRTYTSTGLYLIYGTSKFDIINFIPDINMETKELKIQIPEGQEIDWQESAKQEKIVFKKIDTKPRSWEEYCKQHNTTVTECYFLDNEANVRAFGWHPSVPSDCYRNTLPSKELAEAFLVMMQIMSLRQAWIGEWKPDWSDTAPCKYCICGMYNDEQVMKSYCQFRYPLSFPTREMAEDFMNTFRDLIKIAKPLI
jgi:hypothetical protein